MIGRIEGREEFIFVLCSVNDTGAKHRGMQEPVIKRSKEQRSWSISSISSFSPTSPIRPLLFISRWRSDPQFWILWSLSFRKSSPSAILKESRYKSSLACPYQNQVAICIHLSNQESLKYAESIRWTHSGRFGKTNPSTILISIPRKEARSMQTDLSMMDLCDIAKWYGRSDREEAI